VKVRGVKRALVGLETEDERVLSQASPVQGPYSFSVGGVGGLVETVVNCSVCGHFALFLDNTRSQ
jgi:hypothetical protein